MANARLNIGQRKAFATGNLQKLHNQVIQAELCFRAGFAGEFANIDAAARAHLDPAGVGQFAVSGADRIGVNLEAACQFARARQFLSGFQILAKNGEFDLRDHLFA